MPQDQHVEWTDADLDLLQSLDAAGTPIEQIGRRLGRSEAAIMDHLPIVRARHGTLPIPDGSNPADEPNEWLGPDEEGDVAPAASSGDDAAWVQATPRPE